MWVSAVEGAFAQHWIVGSGVLVSGEGVAGH